MKKDEGMKKAYGDAMNHATWNGGRLQDKW